MYYVRFLKVPKISDSRGKSLISAVITLTSDLGDEFYYEDISLYVELLMQSDLQGLASSEKRVDVKKFQWKAGMRSLPVDLLLRDYDSKFPLIMYVGYCPASDGAFKCKGEQGHASNWPVLVNVWSDFLSPSSSKYQVHKCVERRIMLSEKERILLHIWEEIGNSLSRHIWDGGLILLATLAQIRHQQRKDFSALNFCLHQFITPSNSPQQSTGLQNLAQDPAVGMPNILELGTGCGLVGMGFAALYPEAIVWLTDLPEVTDLVQRNKQQLSNIMSRRHEQPQTHIAFESLDWSGPIPETLQAQNLSLILVADCIYNPDSHSALVKTLSGLRELSQAMVLVAWKRRHPAEESFCERMKAAGFEIVERVLDELPEENACISEGGLHIILYRHP